MKDTEHLQKAAPTVLRIPAKQKVDDVPDGVSSACLVSSRCSTPSLMVPL